MRRFALCSILAIYAGFTALAQAQLSTLYSFAGTPDGANSVDKLVFDRAGNLYGTTEWGGANGWGSIFELSPNPNGTWAESTLYDFCASSTCNDGAEPLAGLILDSAGNLYGTAELGGQEDVGVVFELSPPSSSGGTWSYQVLYYFCEQARCSDGAYPYGKLTADASGNLYGTTKEGGVGAGGVVFKLSPGSGGWTETVLYRFCSVGEFPHCADGWGAQAGVTFDRSGNLYGTTSGGGSAKFEGNGTIYKLIPGSNGWTEQVLFVFPAAGDVKGSAPMAEVNFDLAGNLYSTASYGGQNLDGTVFRLTPKGAFQYLSFDLATNGAAPTAGVFIDPRDGVLYGTTSGGSQPQDGTVYKVANGQIIWMASTPQAMGALISDGKGNLYGTTKTGGDNGMGSVFKLTP